MRNEQIQKNNFWEMDKDLVIPLFDLMIETLKRIGIIRISVPSLRERKR